MNKKLTLNVDDSVIEFAHLYSKETNQSISSLFEKYLKGIQRQHQQHQQSDLSPVTLELRGAFKNLDIPDKHELRRIFHEKSLD